MKIYINIVCCLLIAVAVPYNKALADVVVKDSNGMVRSEAIGEGTAIVEAKLELSTPQVVPPIEPQVVLKSESGKELRQKLREGYVRFDEVPGGVYKIGTTAPGFVFTDIKITYPRVSRVGMAVSAGGAAVGAGLLGVAGVTAGTIAIVNHNRSSDSGKKPLSPHS